MLGVGLGSKIGRKITKIVKKLPPKNVPIPVFLLFLHIETDHCFVRLLQSWPRKGAKSSQSQQWEDIFALMTDAAQGTCQPKK